jgi:hypothetical protein
MAYIKESKVLDLQGPILHDLFQVKRYILNQVGISMKFRRSTPDFCLLSNEAKKYKIDIEEMDLRVCKVQVNPVVITAHNAMLSSTTHYTIRVASIGKIHVVEFRCCVFHP